MSTGDVTTERPGDQWGTVPNPTRRPMLRTVLTIGVSGTVFLIFLWALLAMLGRQLDTQVLVVSALMAIIPVFVVVPTFLWVDRFEAEPARYLVFAFLWGALVSVVVAFVLNTAAMLVLLRANWVDPMQTGAIYLAPVTEETLKGLGILLVFLARRREFDGIVDGVVYAGFIGAGFAFSENILYLGNAYTQYGNEGLTATFVVRGLMGPFAHSLFTACTGVGIGIAVSSAGRAARTAAVVIGWVCAMLLHGVWNFAALAGQQGFFEAYLSFQVPLFLAFVGFLFWLRRREGRLIGQHLSAYADAGWLTYAEVSMLSHLAARRDARAWARSQGGRPAKRSMTAFQDTATELALLRSRIVHGTAERDATTREMVLLTALTAYRKEFVGSPVT